MIDAIAILWIVLYKADMLSSKLSIFKRFSLANLIRFARPTLSLMALLVMILFGIPGSRPDTSGEAFVAVGIARNHLFNFVDWEADAVIDKSVTALLAPHSYMSEEERSQFVLDYLATINELHSLEDQVQAVYTDPSVADAEVASEELRRRRDHLRDQQQAQQAIAEAIVQAQVSQVLVEQGFSHTDTLFPPVYFRFTQLPTVMIVSPRDRIERIGAYPLDHGLTVDEKDLVELEVDETLDVSTLIVPLGGLAVFPAMLIETGWAPSVFDIAAHEWAHHYLAFYPLGFNYGITPDLYTMNETVASIIGREIAYEVLLRHYPELATLIPAPDYTPVSDVQEPIPDAQQLELNAYTVNPVLPYPFDFRAEMRETRQTVDALLAEGRIEEAEAYMEDRRAYFVTNGRPIRKLNQAYFAFYGAYADQPGATGGDPIGPSLRELRYHSDDLYHFVERVRGATTFEEIQLELEQARQDAELE